MTRPPEDPRDPYNDPPGTRRFDPLDETAAHPAPGPEYGETGPTEPVGYDPRRPADPSYQDPAYSQAYGAQDPYGPQGGYPDQSYGDQNYGPPPGGPYDDPRGGDGGGNRGRTAGLVLAVLAAIVVIVLVAFLIARGSSDDELPATSSSATSQVTTTSAEPTTTTTTRETTTTTTTSAPPPGEVVYQITGSGDVVGLRYAARGQTVLIAATATPWSQTARVNGGSAELTALVIRGPVTCTILRGEKLLTSSTSNGGPLRCAATFSE
ncbi:hypothetical protein [Gordonia soli]|uniref:MmpS family membrane protein n=1 Tax=Gordonia soli NBRC 108243 TaxID=1223545 RepID=M0QFX9_9ACTN|nr:hypothetical protein [Gordonia soli]GAC67216.1 hypothetical protein GS4_06_00620 [Gordonia soli NBRC 108243]